MSIFGVFSPNVEKLKNKKDIEGLIDAMGYNKNPAIPKAAQEALVQIGKPAVGPLIERLNDKEFWIQQPYEIYKPIYLGSIKALMEIGDERAIKPLISFFYQHCKTTSDIYYYPVEKALLSFGPAAVYPLIESIDKSEMYEEKVARAGCTSIIGEILKNGADKSAGDAFLRTLNTAGRENRAMVVYALGKIREPRAIDPLTTLLLSQDEAFYTRKAAAVALGQIGDARAEDALRIASHTDENPEVREVASDALSKIEFSKIARGNR